MEIKTISILGCGWFGLPFAKEMVASGFSVNGSTTSEAKLKELQDANIKAFIINTNEDISDDTFFNCDLLLINIPPKKKIPDVNLYPTQLQKIAEKAVQHGIKQIIFIGSTGIFEDGNFIVDENTIPNPSTPAGLKLKIAEEVFTKNQNFTSTIIRFAGLIGPNRNLAKFFAGKTSIPNGLAPINLIHLADCIGFCKAIIIQQAFGKTYHAVAPSHPPRATFYTKLCLSSEMDKPNFLEEKTAWKQVESDRTKSNLAYQFKITDWLSWAAEPTML